MKYIKEIEQKLKLNAKKYFPYKLVTLNQLVDTKKLKQLVNHKPNTSVRYGIGKFIDWYLKYYNVKNNKISIIGQGYVGLN